MRRGSASARDERQGRATDVFKTAGDKKRQPGAEGVTEEKRRSCVQPTDGRYHVICDGGEVGAR